MFPSGNTFTPVNSSSYAFFPAGTVTGFVFHTCVPEVLIFTTTESLYVELYSYPTATYPSFVISIFLNSSAPVVPSI